MPINLIDKFNEIINRGKQNEIESIENEVKADEFWNEMKQKDANGKYMLVAKMHEFNINNYDTLVHLLGYSSVGTIYNYLQDKNPVGKEFKKRLYNFFSNEMNIQMPKNIKVKKVIDKKIEHYNELDEYYEKTDFKKIFSDNRLLNRDVAHAIGVHDSTISTMASKKCKPSYKILGNVKQFLDDITQKNNDEEIITNKKIVSTEYVSKQKIISQCESEIKELQEKIDEMTAKIELAKKIVDFINNIN